MVRTVEPAKPKKTETETKPVVKKEIKTKASKPKEKVTKSKKVSKQ
jgi:hypothetical protein